MVAPASDKPSARTRDAESQVRALRQEVTRLRAQVEDQRKGIWLLWSAGTAVALVFGVLLPFVIERTDDGADPVSVAVAGFRGETQSGAEVAFSLGFVGLTVLAVALAGLQLQGLGTGPGTEYRGRAQLVLGLLVLVGSFVPVLISVNSLLPDTGPKDTVGSGWGGLVLMGGAVAALLLRRMRLDDRTGRR